MKTWIVLVPVIWLGCGGITVSPPAGDTGAGDSTTIPDSGDAYYADDTAPIPELPSDTTTDLGSDSSVTDPGAHPDDSISGADPTALDSVPKETGPTTDSGPVLCKADEACPEGYYCEKKACDATLGECAEKPTLCPKLFKPVCGCDGVTYDNACFAAANGVNVAHEGVCGDCKLDADCALDSFCKKAACTDTWGSCTKKPTMCLNIEKPVCGCDGNTYKNECFAEMEGVNVAHDGACEDCRLDTDCAVDSFCKKAACADVLGICAKKPTLCPIIENPVCGCDGSTYQNECFADMEGVNVDYPGKCPPQRRR